ncbi:hypothetical protein PIB30_086121 [Stylosanthes scabra]|uniref:Uncharacterized protein n=1 Tax=Stylosanthes scabra TaxID=79078 RepID=A0ABU6WST5_9FABA|nr:hypothetical protein [Stylosanthes scabra]
MIQEEENNLDPEIQPKLAMLDSEIQTQIHHSFSLNTTVKSSTDQGITADSEPFFSKSKNQHSESLTTFPEIGNTKSSSKIQHHIQTITSTSGSEALPTTDPKQDKENLGWLELEAARVEVAHRPPPKPPNLPLVADNRTRSSKRASGGDNSIPVRSGTEDGAVAKGERTLVMAGDQGSALLEGDGTTDRSYNGWKGIVDCRAVRSTVVGASARGNWTGVIATMTDGRLRDPQLRRLFLLNLPPLVAAVFSWDRRGRNSGFEEDLFSSLLTRLVSLRTAAMTSYNGAFTEARCPWSREREAVIPGFGGEGRCGGEVVERGTGQGEVVSHGFLSTQRGLPQNEGVGELTPILGLGFNWRGLVQAQNKYKQNESSLVVSLQIVFQAQLDPSLGKQQLYLLFIGELHF